MELKLPLHCPTQSETHTHPASSFAFCLPTFVFLIDLRMWERTRFSSSKAKMGSLIIASVLLVFGVWLMRRNDLMTIERSIQKDVMEKCVHRQYFRQCREFITIFVAVPMAVGYVTGVFEAIVGGLLIYGILKQKKRLIQALLIMLVIQLIVHILCCMGILYMATSYNDLAHVFSAMTAFCLYLLVEACLLLVIRAHYLQIKLSKLE
nr:uncharacterized protein LOC123765527 [Procambarus clarkii]